MGDVIGQERTWAVASPVGPCCWRGETRWSEGIYSSVSLEVGEQGPWTQRSSSARGCSGTCPRVSLNRWVSAQPGSCDAERLSKHASDLVPSSEVLPGGLVG